jgi:hypothetical protein
MNVGFVLLMFLKRLYLGGAMVSLLSVAIQLNP